MPAVAVDLRRAVARAGPESTGRQHVDRVLRGDGIPPRSPSTPSTSHTYAGKRRARRLADFWGTAVCWSTPDRRIGEDPCDIGDQYRARAMRATGVEPEQMTLEAER